MEVEETEGTSHHYRKKPLGSRFLLSIKIYGHDKIFTVRIFQNADNDQE